jgi:glycosyltransferase involved in cell wall biosynthesis
MEKAENYLLYFGRLTNEKGIWTLIQAMEKTAADLSLYVVGDGPESKKIEHHLQICGLNNRIKLVGPKYGDELSELIRGAKAVVIPSIWRENMPYSLLEALASGKAVIASKSGGMPELIRDGISGFLFQVGDSEDLTDQINRLDNHDLVRIGNEARRAITVLNSEHYYQTLVKNYALLRDKYQNKSYDEKISRSNIALQPAA